ncbi:unnamed protein product [Rangifer tarandus platyrhynchus]|uniref:Uncharacterized protein n=1 Tax=Rangifer tarandus platyrhynchus TaxID=3082113 RepID=A0AC59YJ47_RANTA
MFLVATSEKAGGATASGGERSGMLPNILQCSEHLSQHRIKSPNVHSAVVEEPGWRDGVWKEEDCVGRKRSARSDQGSPCSPRMALDFRNNCHQEGQVFGECYREGSLNRSHKPALKVTSRGKCSHSSRKAEATASVIPMKPGVCHSAGKGGLSPARARCP